MEKLRNQLNRALSPSKSILNNQMEIASLIQTIEKLQGQNRILYRVLIQHDPSFDHQLYRPKSEPGLSIQIQKELKLKQIDRLLDQQSQLTKKKQEVLLKKQFAEQNKQKLICKAQSQFSYTDLRRITSSIKNTDIDASQKVDELNKFVKQIKIKIDNEIKNENLWIKNNKAIENVPYISFKKYSKLEYQYNELQAQILQLKENNRRLYDIISEKDKIIQENIKARSHLNLNINQLRSKNIQLQKNIENIENIIKKKEIQNKENSICYQFQNIKQAIKIIVTDKKLLHDLDARNTQKTLKQIINFLEERKQNSQALDLISVPLLAIPTANQIPIRKVLSDRNWSKKIQTLNKNYQPEELQNKGRMSLHLQKSISICPFEAQLELLNNQTSTLTTSGKGTDRKNPRFKRSKINAKTQNFIEMSFLQDY